MWVKFIAVALLTLHLSAAFPDIYKIVPDTVVAAGNDAANVVDNDGGPANDSNDVVDTSEDSSLDSSLQKPDDAADDGLIR